MECILRRSRLLDFTFYIFVLIVGARRVTIRAAAPPHVRSRRIPFGSRRTPRPAAIPVRLQHGVHADTHHHQEPRPSG